MINKFTKTETINKQVAKFKDILIKLPVAIKKRLVQEIAHIHEKAYRRGYHQACSHLLTEDIKKSDDSSKVSTWRHSNINNSEGAPLSIEWSTSLEDRLNIEMNENYYLLNTLIKMEEAE